MKRHGSAQGTQGQVQVGDAVHGVANTRGRRAVVYLFGRDGRTCGNAHPILPGLTKDTLDVGGVHAAGLGLLLGQVDEVFIIIGRQTRNRNRM